MRFPLRAATAALFIVSVTGAPAAMAQATADDVVRVAGSHEYPRTFTVEGGTVTVHHPQVETWENFETMSGWLVIELNRDDADEPWLGSVLVRAKTDIDFDERLVVVHDIEIAERKFDNDPPAQVMALASDVLTGRPRTVPLDVFIRVLPEDFEPPRRGMAPPLGDEPPVIFASVDPAELMIINGDPLLVPIDNTDLEFVVNTNWDLFYHTDKERWYVLNGTAWQYTKRLDAPDWKVTTRLPGDFRELPDEANWSRVRQHLPAKRPDNLPPAIIVSQRPAELILVDGPPQTERIPGTDIAFVRNTLSDLFLHGGDYYYLVSGRWFVAPQLSGPYTPVESLPESFLYIPADHERGHVVASVPGSDEARAARIEALIPRQAAISRTAGADLEVVYAGEPQFVDIEGTSLKRAANTQSQVILAGSSYYLCSNGVWFVSLSPNGPWRVAETVPDAIYSIPPSDPAHNTTYVYIIDDDDDDTVTYGYTSGYYGAYVTPYSVMFGTGYYYYPYVYYPPYGYPYYYPYPASYGYAAYYNTATGAYASQSVAYGPYGGAASTAVYNPNTGAYGRGYSAWDSDEVARTGYAYNPRTNTYAAGNAYYDYGGDEGWREGYVQRDDQWVYGESSFDSDQVSRELETSSGGTASQQRTSTGDAVTGSAELQGSERSVSTSSFVDESGGELSVEGGQGGSADFSKESGETGVDISGTTAEGTDFTGTAERTENGGRAAFESEDGGAAAVRRDGTEISGAGQSADGEYYAGRDGNVFRSSEDGWQRYNDGNWDNVGSTLDRSNLERQRSGREIGTQNFSEFRRQRESGARGGRSNNRRSGRGRSGSGRRRR